MIGAIRTCRVCGCTEQHACYNPKDGACSWADQDLCSHCVPTSLLAHQTELVAAAADYKATVNDLVTVLKATGRLKPCFSVKGEPRFVAALSACRRQSPATERPTDAESA